MQTKKGKLIGVINQKGGVGKSTICCHLAMSLYHGSNFEKSSNFVSIYDADKPQWSLFNYREKEVEILQELSTGENNFFEAKLSNIYSDSFIPMSIYNGDIIEYSGASKSLRDNFDYTFVDVVGTVNTKGYDEDFLKSFDFIIIPTSSDYESIRSSMSFVENVINPISQTSSMKYSILLNDVQSVEINSYNFLKESLIENNYSVFNTVINSRKKYIRLYLHYKGKEGLLSTLFPSYDRSFSNLVDEFLTKVNS